MKKLYVGLIFGIFAMASFVALNLYTGTSLPGFSNNKACNYCHNQPALVKDVTSSFAMNDFTAMQNAFSNTQWASDEVPVVQTNNRSLIEFTYMVFLKNSTHVMVMAQVPDDTPYNSSLSIPSDKFGIIFNIDVANFTVGDFLTSYTTGQPLSTTLSGQMAFTQGHADFWYVDVASIGVNKTGYAENEYISTGILHDATQYQTNIHVAVWYGNTGSASRVSMAYRYYFVRALNNTDVNDAQFNLNGATKHYAIAAWNDNSTYYHLSSFDQMVIVGSSYNILTQTSVVTNVQTTTETKTVTAAGSTSTSGTASSFTIGFVLVGLLVSIPLVSRMKHRKN